MKTEIIPAILSENFKDFRKKIKRLKEKYKKKNVLVQVDLCDGSFVPSKTIMWKPCKKYVSKINEILEGYKLELDLMIELSNEKKIDSWFKKISDLKAKRIIFHLDSVKDWNLLFQKLKEYKIKAEIGLAVQIKHKCQKDIMSIFENHPFKYIQFMGIEKIGYGGQKLSQKIFRKISKFHKLKPETPIQVDGGVKTENAQKLLEKGVSRFVAGSGIFGAKDLKERIEKFLS